MGASSGYADTVKYMPSSDLSVDIAVPAAVMDVVAAGIVATGISLSTAMLKDEADGRLYFDLSPYSPVSIRAFLTVSCKRALRGQYYSRIAKIIILFKL